MISLRDRLRWQRLLQRYAKRVEDGGHTEQAASFGRRHLRSLGDSRLRLPDRRWDLVVPFEQHDARNVLRDTR